MAGMDDLRQYLKDLPDDGARDAFAKACSTSVGHLRNVCYGLRQPAPELCVLLEKVTAGAVTRRHLRPGDWHRIWPELVTPEHPMPVEAA